MAIKVCPDCRMTIDEEASVCPYCHRKFDLTPVYRERMFKTGFWCCFLGIGIFCFGFSKEAEGFWATFLSIIGGIILFIYGVNKFKQWVRTSKSK